MGCDTLGAHRGGPCSRATWLRRHHGPRRPRTLKRRDLVLHKNSTKCGPPSISFGMVCVKLVRTYFEFIGCSTSPRPKLTSLRSKFAWPRLNPVQHRTMLDEFGPKLGRVSAKVDRVRRIRGSLRPNLGWLRTTRCGANPQIDCLRSPPPPLHKAANSAGKRHRLCQFLTPGAVLLALLEGRRGARGSGLDGQQRHEREVWSRASRFRTPKPTSLTNVVCLGRMFDPKSTPHRRNIDLRLTPNRPQVDRLTQDPRVERRFGDKSSSGRSPATPSPTDSKRELWPGADPRKLQCPHPRGIAMAMELRASSGRRKSMRIGRDSTAMSYSWRFISWIGRPASATSLRCAQGSRPKGSSFRTTRSAALLKKRCGADVAAQHRPIDVGRNDAGSALDLVESGVWARAWPESYEFRQTSVEIGQDVARHSANFGPIPTSSGANYTDTDQIRWRSEQ